MPRILINGMNSKVGGGMSMLTNILALLRTAALPGEHYHVITPPGSDYSSCSREHITIEAAPSWTDSALGLVLGCEWYLPRRVEELKVDILLNIADVPIRTHRREVYLFDWPYAAYPSSPVWRMMRWGPYIKRLVKLFLFKHNLKYTTHIIVQNKTMQTRLRRLYSITDTSVVGNAVSVDHMRGGITRDFKLPSDRIKLLCLTYYYPHKNIEIFLPLARLMRERGLRYTIIVTLDRKQDPAVGAFLDSVAKEGLGNYIVNIGHVPMPELPSLYAQSDALLLPTLLESFSGTYVEAMYHQRPIITSNLDFARDVCGDAAMYVEPSDPTSILEGIETVFSSPDKRSALARAGEERLATFKDWPQTLAEILRIVRSCLDRPAHSAVAANG